ncbi:MAG: acryloyl-CoA reductase [Pseudomonadota bacterium]|nr:acryloyl-CoA reductase [Pseudomonadota bacterium]
MDTFKALRIYSDHEATHSSLEDLTLNDLSEGEVVIQSAWSSVNYKDAMAFTGTGKILRKSPLVGGIDVAGKVIDSTDSRFNIGDAVFVTSAGLSETRDGGYSELARLQADSTIKIPEVFTAREVMALGTAGFTAALAVHSMEHNGQHPNQGPVAVNGATGGVGSVAIDLLSGRGYEVHAITAKPDAVDYLKSLGAQKVITPDALEMGTRPLEKAIWSGAIDSLGGEMLAWFTRTTKYGGNIASIGLAASPRLEATVIPFILRGINLLGINAVDTTRQKRLEVWERLASDLRPRHLDKIVTREIALAEVAETMSHWIEGRVMGRSLVKIS